MSHHPLTLRRRELLLGSCAAIAGAGCFDSPREKILPYVRRPPEVTPGLPLEYATSMVVDGLAVGLLVQSREGRPIKVEGNPDHPASLGATGAFEQASLLGLYDPTRSRAVLRAGRPQSFATLFETITRADQRGLRFLLPPQSSPLLGALFEAIADRHPDSRVCFHAPLDLSAPLRATRILFGDPRAVQYDFRRARTVVSLDADFTCSMPMSLRSARHFADLRRLRAPNDEMGRFYAVEAMPTPTGTLADHHLAVRSVDIPAIAAALLREVSDNPPEALRGMALPEHHAKVVRAMADDLKAHRGECLVVVGDQQPLSTHLLGHLINAELENLGATVTLTPSPFVEPRNAQSLDDLLRDLRLGRVRRLAILEDDPVYSLASLDLEALLRPVDLSFHLSLHQDHTSRACLWHVPASHFLECWGDGRAYDGTVSFVQPLVRPLYETRSVTAILAAFAGQSASDYDLLRDHWRAQWSEPFEPVWEAHIQRGFVPQSAPSPVEGEPAWADAEPHLRDLTAPAALEVHFEPSPKVHDGRFASNPWLQELPHPLTKITWTNAAILSPEKVAAFGLRRGEIVRLTVHGRSIELPVYDLPGHAEESITVALGYGRHLPGVPAGGANAYRLRTPEARHGRAGVTLEKTGAEAHLPITQDHGHLHGREIALHHDLAHYRDHPEFTHHHKKPLPSLLPVLLDRPPEQWAMTIDTMICTGCSACVVACQAENNIPVVGPEGVRRGREMHWLRIDRYFVEHHVIHQPMACQHCEKAPCEYVCPVNATVHSPDGLNEMVYNRCVGTRFCSNNCPYKVRRFNWFEYQAEEPIPMQHNPDVTVRERGVMEKCTYCVQRIRRAERAARAESRALRPNEVVTACAQACPTRAIQFGLLSHHETDMVRWREEPRVYSVLHELGARPRTQYLAKIINPDPALS